MANQTEVYEITLVGFPGLPEKYNIPISILMLLVYMASVSANGIVITMVMLKEQLHKPMYLIIANLATADLLFDTITLPKMIGKYWFGVTTTFPECLLQMFLVHYLNTTDSYIFMLMAIDRYVAICKPLRYPSIISRRAVGIGCCVCWVVASFTALTALVMNAHAPPCGSNKINTVMCTNIAVTALACQDTSLIKKTTYVFAMVILFLPLSFILPSYIIIIHIIRSSPGTESWRKAFYTCTTHLCAIAVHYVPRVFVYTAHEVNLNFNADINVLLLCLYSYVPHVCNPIIYCLRNKDIKGSVAKLLPRRILFKGVNVFSPQTITI
ncbi:olfactory receptor 2AT4-like [Spea bombifrons]|uniref:olfactory receptor 2AT4-like n=1 Tax=Spea bombifrons TaxID=233779 RepID=UPI0023492E5A|nr:olfactory receptor 2AT4-like [Spea bombifrons]